MTESGTGKNFQELLQTAQNVQQELNKIQGELANMTVEGASGGGMVVAVANGRQQLVSLRVEREVVDPAEVGMLQDLVVAAVNNALTKASELAQQEMSKVTGQMNLKLTGLI